MNFDWSCNYKKIGKLNLKMWIKEAITIRKQGTIMNRDKVEYNLTHVFNDLLVYSNTFKNFVGNTSRTRNTSGIGNVVTIGNSQVQV